MFFILQATIKSNHKTHALSTLVLGSNIEAIGSDKLDTIEIIGPAVAGFLPRNNLPYLTMSITTITGSDQSLFKVGRNVKVTWGSTEVHIRSPIHVEDYGTLILPDAVYIENGGVLDICGTLLSDTGTVTVRDGGKLQMSDPARTLSLYALLIDYKGHLGASTYCPSSTANVTIEATFYNTTSNFTLDTSKFVINATHTGELSKIGEILQNITCNTERNCNTTCYFEHEFCELDAALQNITEQNTTEHNSTCNVNMTCSSICGIELERNQFCELDVGTHNFTSIIIHPGAELRLLGDPSGTETTNVYADVVNIMFEGKLTGVGTGFQSDGPGMPAVSDQGASHGGKGKGSYSPPYGNVKAPMQYGSNGKEATATSKRGGGQIKLDVKNSTTIDGEIDVSGQERGSGGSVYIISPELHGFGTIRADGGNGGGGGGRISVVADDIYSFTGEFSVQGGADSSGKPTSSGLYWFPLAVKWD